MENEIYLSGGFFFSLLTEKKSLNRPQRDRLAGKADSVSQKNMLIGLIRQIQPDFREPMGDTLKTIASAYKNCKESGSSVYLPFHDADKIKDYDRKVRENFSEALGEMKEYGDRYLNWNSNDDRKWLGCALLSLLKNDRSIDDEEKLFYQKNGMAKKEILALNRIFLPALILAIWHFIVTKRKDNTKGKTTIDAWKSADDDSMFVNDEFNDRKFDVDVEADVEVNKNESEVKSMNNHKQEQEQESKQNRGQAEQLEDKFEKFSTKFATSEGKNFCYQEVHMINNGPAPQIKEHNGDIHITIMSQPAPQ